MSVVPYNDFIFSHRYRVWRHVIFWGVYIFFLGYLFSAYSKGIWSLQRMLFSAFLWLPVFILYCYPFIYRVIPKYLLKEKYVIFIFIVVLWIVAGWYINYLFRAYVFIPLQDALQFKNIPRDPWMPGTYLTMTTAWGITSIITLFKYWFKKQHQWLKTEKEKVTAELQLLKAQVHPHFLFNTLNNIYSFSLENSPKTPGMILKLSSLLSYMLYDCRAEEVRLEKEIEIMNNYIDLEKERYGNKIEISWSADGDIKDKFIAPLLMLPFLENAFKHGTSEQVERPWLNVDISVKQDTLRCKIANSKNEYVPHSKSGIGVQNVKKRLSLIYPDMHELKMNDEGNFFVVSLLIKITNLTTRQASAPVPIVLSQTIAT